MLKLFETEYLSFSVIQRDDLVVGPNLQRL